MRLCGDCRKKPWPYAIVLFIATFVAFVTWLTLSAAGLSESSSIIWTSISFVAAVVLLASYMVSCMRRHCSDDKHQH